MKLVCFVIRKFVLSLLAITFTFFTCAVLENVNNVKGLYSAIKEEFKYLSPFHGFIFHEKNIARNYYKYTDKKDPINKFTRELFSLHGETFRASYKKNKLATYLNYATISAIIVIIDKIKDQEKLNITLTDFLTKNILINNNKNKIIKNFVNRLIEALASSGHFEKEKQIYPNYIVYHLLLTFLYMKINKKEELKLYFDELRELNNGENILTENIWQWSYNSQDYAKILEQFREQPKELSWDYAVNFYEEISSAIIITQNYGGKYPKYIEMGKALISWFKNNIAESDISDIKDYVYSDCMETALRNLINLILWDADNAQFNLSKLPFKISLNAPVAQFYENFTITKAESQNARNKWGDYVSNIPGALYLSRVKKDNNNIIVESLEKSGGNFVCPDFDDGWYYYELSPTLETIAPVINRLFGLELNNFEEFISAFNLTCDIKKTERELICKIDVSEQNCTLMLAPATAITKSFITEKIIFPYMHEIIRDKILKENYKNLEKMVNIFGFNFELINLDQETDKLKLVNNTLLKHIILAQNLSRVYEKNSIIKFIISNIPDAPHAPWYYKLANILAKDIIFSHPNRIDDLLVNLAKNAKSSGSIKLAKNIINRNFLRLEDTNSVQETKNILKAFIKKKNIWSIKWIQSLLNAQFNKFSPLFQMEVISELAETFESKEMKKYLTDWFMKFFENKILSSIKIIPEEYKVNIFKNIIISSHKKWRTDFIKNLIEKVLPEFSSKNQIILLINIISEVVYQNEYWNNIISKNTALEKLISLVKSNPGLINDLNIFEIIHLLSIMAEFPLQQELEFLKEIIFDRVKLLEEEDRELITEKLLLNPALWGKEFIDKLSKI